MFSEGIQDAHIGGAEVYQLEDQDVGSAETLVEVPTIEPEHADDNTITPTNNDDAEILNDRSSINGDDLSHDTFANGTSQPIDEPGAVSRSAFTSKWNGI